MAKRDTYNYNLKQGNKVVYKGTTNDPERRKDEHRDSGKKFDSMEIDGRAKTSKNAQKEEARQLEVYRKNHRGNNPKYNKSDQG